MSPAEFEPLRGYDNRLTPEVMMARAAAYREQFLHRRSVRSFRRASVPRQVIEDCLLAASASPSGANHQPWHFVAVADTQLKQRIRRAAEQEEQEFYSQRAPTAWLEALAPLGTDARKPFLEDAAWLIAIFAEAYAVDSQGVKIKHYYVNESVGIATGTLINALHHVGLATLTHTPSPMRFLNSILNRPAHERPYLLLAVGLPDDACQVPKITKKSLQQIATFVE